MTTIMSQKRRRRNRGWKIGSAVDFMNLSKRDKEIILLEAKKTKEEKNRKQRERYKNDPIARKKAYEINNNCVRKMKMEVLEHYGGSCKCCGESEREFLSIDHINGNGNKHRRQIGKKTGTSFYYWLKKNNYPDGFQVLCFN